MCTCVAYRPPAYLAKVAATIDVISGGRVDLGIGAGWYEHEYAGYGYEFLPPAGRIGQFREADRDHEAAVDRGRGPLRGPPLPPGWGHLPAPAAAGPPHPHLGGRGRGAAHPAGGGPPRLAHQLRPVPRGLRPQVRGPGRPLPGPGHRLRRHRPLHQPVRDLPGDGGRGGRRPRRDPRPLPPGGARGAGGARRRRCTAPWPAPRSNWPSACAPGPRSGLGYAIVYFPQAAYDPTDLELFAREVMPAFA